MMATYYAGRGKKASTLLELRSENADEARRLRMLSGFAHHPVDLTMKRLCQYVLDLKDADNGIRADAALLLTLMEGR